jgi:hypothetical protein
MWLVATLSDPDVDIFSFFFGNLLSFVLLSRYREVLEELDQTQFIAKTAKNFNDQRATPSSISSPFIIPS